jgi:hypothetical protein
MLKNKTKIKIVFWTHFLFALVSHVIVPVMIGGMFRLLWGSNLDFWTSGLLLGATFFSCTYIINHITHDDGFCCLTELENYYRAEENLPKVNKFLPRFYKKCRAVIRYVRWK